MSLIQFSLVFSVSTGWFETEVSHGHFKTNQYSGGSRPPDKGGGGGGQPDPEIREGRAPPGPSP